MRSQIFNLIKDQSTLSWEQIAANIIVSGILVFLIFISYMISHRGTIYSKKFNVSLVVLTVLTSMVMTVIGNNVALSLGMVGALSIVRFRTAIKDSRDTVYIFWTIIVGICCGVGDFIVAGIGSGFVFILFLILGAIKNNNRMLVIIRGDRTKEAQIQGVMFKFFGAKAVLRVKNSTTESIEFIYEITAKLLSQEEKKITESILKGFEKNEFKMYLQFIVDNKTKKIVSAEALSRWDSPDKGLVSPGKYIGNMEMAGLISKHDFYMIELACRQLEKWKGTAFENIALSCNFTRITLSEENFIDKLKMISNSYSFDKSKIAIEITEDAMEKNRETATKNVRLCKELGFRIYLDDLGSGYTSLANLCDYPIDVVKIDRDILLKTEKEKGKDLFTGIIALAHSLNIKVICEGVKTEKQNTLVSLSACDFVQGWYYSKALPLEECESFINGYEIRRF